jgi:hypothetical protein
MGIMLFLITSLAYGGTTQEKWQDTCDILEVDCTDMAPPTVVVTSLMGALGLYGAYYPGEHMIFVDPYAPEKTEVHEMTHYLLYELGLFRDNRCMSEEVARRVHHKWEGTTYDDTWRSQYRC